MRTVSIPKIVLLSSLLLLMAVAVQVTAYKPERKVKEPLSEALGSLPGWSASPPAVLGSQIEEALKLDDNLFRSYRRGNDTVSLYIGYYRSADKIGAAHDPLVCFTGQGWRLTERRTGTYTLKGPENLVVNYSTMIAEHQAEKEYLLYWFQTNGTTSARTFDQKIQMLTQRLSKVPQEENAFVRVSTRIEGSSSEDAKKRVLEFVDTFYPQFYSYVRM